MAFSNKKSIRGQKAVWMTKPKDLLFYEDDEEDKTEQTLDKAFALAFATYKKSRLLI